MNEILFTVALCILGICLFSILIYWIISKVKCNNFDKTNDRLEEATLSIVTLDNIIDSCVSSINQKMVSALKKENSFLIQSDKEESFNECRKMVYSMVTCNILDDFKYLGINIDSWINTRIEYFVRKQKEQK